MSTQRPFIVVLAALALVLAGCSSGRDGQPAGAPMTRPVPSTHPQDVKLAPDGRVYYVADMASNGVRVIDAARPRPGRYSLGHTGVFR